MSRSAFFFFSGWLKCSRLTFSRPPLSNPPWSFSGCSALLESQITLIPLTSDPAERIMLACLRQHKRKQRIQRSFWLYLRYSDYTAHLSLSCPSEWPPSSSQSVGRCRTKSGGGAPNAQIRSVVRGVLPQRQIHCQCGKPAWHDCQCLGLEGNFILLHYIL